MAEPSQPAATPWPAPPPPPFPAPSTPWNTAPGPYAHHLAPWWASHYPPPPYSTPALPHAPSPLPDQTSLDAVHRNLDALEARVAACTHSQKILHESLATQITAVTQQLADLSALLAPYKRPPSDRAPASPPKKRRPPRNAAPRDAAPLDGLCHFCHSTIHVSAPPHGEQITPDGTVAIITTHDQCLTPNRPRLLFHVACFRCSAADCPSPTAIDTSIKRLNLCASSTIRRGPQVVAHRACLRCTRCDKRGDTFTKSTDYIKWVRRRGWFHTKCIPLVLSPKPPKPPETPESTESQ